MLGICLLAPPFFVCVCVLTVCCVVLFLFFLVCVVGGEGHAVYLL